MKKIYLLPNVITAFGLSCGLFVIFRMNMTEVGDVTEQVLIATAWILILAAFADLLDGAVARAMHAESDFGILFDSLSDAITFGVAPSVVILKTLSIQPGTESSFLMTAGAMVYTICGVLRLIRYNLTIPASIGTPEILPADKKNFTGLPIPAAAGAMISLNLFLFHPEFIDINPQYRTFILFAALIVVGYFMICRWRFPGIKALKVRVTSFRMVFITVLGAVFIFYGVFHHFPLFFFLTCWLYIVVALSLSFIRITTGKKSKTLEDFEPEPEDPEDL